ncbi:uncharacterized protein LOC144118382 [Amblyomma americanum]
MSAPWDHSGYTSPAEVVLTTMIDEEEDHTMPEVMDSSKKPNETAVSIASWDERQTKLLLDYYARYARDVGPLKKFRSKRAMFEQIACDMFGILGIHRTAVQCETRFKTVSKRKRNEEKHNNTSGNSRCRVEYEQEFDAIKAIDDSLEPEVLRGVDTVRYKKASTRKASPRPSTSADVQENSEFSGDTLSLISSGGDCSFEAGTDSQDEEPKKKRADRRLRPSNSRMQHLQLFFDEMNKLHREKEKKKEDREQRKEQRHQELLKAHSEHMALLKTLAEKE